MQLIRTELFSGVSKDSPILNYKFSRLGALIDYGTKKIGGRERISDADFRKMVAFAISSVSHQVKHMEGLSEAEIKVFKQIMYWPWENDCPRTTGQTGWIIQNHKDSRYHKVFLEKTSQIDKEKTLAFFSAFYDIMRMIEAPQHGVLDRDNPTHQAYQLLSCLASVSGTFSLIARDYVN